MNKYVVKTGQNLYDVALTLYGSIEGVFDLLVSNPRVSFNTTLQRGMELNYHDSFVINQDIVSWFDTNNLTIKNGKYKINIIDVKKQIIDWIEGNNKIIAAKYLSGELKEIEENVIKPNNPYDWDEWEEISDVSKSKKSKASIKGRSAATTIDEWDVLTDNLKYFSISEDTLDFAKKLSGIDFSELDDDNLFANLNIMFINGMIVVPSNDNEKQAYYNSTSYPKILIRQTGKNTVLNMQIKNGSFVVIDWGDCSPLSFYHYQATAASATHTYEDDGEHTIAIYGGNKFINLDFTQVNGVYYAMSEIYISKGFYSLYPNATDLNKLFIKKDAQ